MFKTLTKLTLPIALLGTILSLSTNAEAVTLDEATLLNANDGFQLSSGGSIFLDPAITAGCSFNQVTGGTCGALAAYTLAGHNFVHASILEIGNLLNAIDDPSAYSDMAVTTVNNTSESSSSDSNNFFNNSLDALGNLLADTSRSKYWKGLTTDVDSPSTHVEYRVQMTIPKDNPLLKPISTRANIDISDALSEPGSGHWLKLVKTPEPAMISLLGLGAISLLALRRHKS